MTKENDDRFMTALETFKNAAVNLQGVWEEVDHTGDFYAQDYPFAKSFDEVVADILNWYETQER